MADYTSNFYADGTIEPAGYRQITDVSSAVGVTIGGGRVAQIQVLNANVRWRDDGVDPTPTIGMRIAAGQTLPYVGDLRRIKFIEESAGAEINLSAYK